MFVGVTFFVSRLSGFNANRFGSPAHNAFADYINVAFEEINVAFANNINVAFANYNVAFANYINVAFADYINVAFNGRPRDKTDVFSLRLTIGVPISLTN